MQKLFLVVIAILLLALPVAAQDQTVPRFESAECPFAAPDQVECGFVVVPEFHSEPDGDTLRLSVVIRRGTNPDAEPMIVLSGGPGEKTTENAGFFITGNFAEVAGAERDLIVFDQRGVGLSEPALECPEYTESMLALLEAEPDPEAMARQSFDALIACHDRLVSEGYDLSAFNTVENAADVADIAEALGYEQVNLVGVSYGSALAQAVMRDYPEIVRTATIDSVLPPNRSFFIDTATTVTESLTRLIAACTADEACNAAYPNLQQVLFDVIDELNANPVSLTITNPATGESYDTYLTGDAVLGNLAIFLYQAPVLPLLPQAIYNVSQGDYSLMGQLSGAVLPAYTALTRGMMYSVFCADDIIGRAEDELLDVYEALPPQYRGMGSLDLLTEYSSFDVCAAWGVPELDAALEEPITSDIPTLVMGGEFDPVTPFTYAQEVAENLSNSYIYRFPSIGHSVLNSNECAREMAAEFMNDPTSAPDGTCIAEIPPVEFVLPPPSGDIEFIEFTSDQFGFSSIIPEAWDELAPGIYAPSSVSTTVVLQQALPGAAEDAVALLESQLGQTLEERERISAPALDWTLYQTSIQGLVVDVAIAADDTQAYILLLQATQADHDTAYETVFLPILMALTPAG